MSGKQRNRNKGIHNTPKAQTIEMPFPDAHEAGLWSEPFIHILLILAAGFATYFNSISSPFIFDDYPNLITNPAIKNFDIFPDTAKVFQTTIHNEIKDNIFLRPVTYFTFALNYAIHGLNHFGYHITNLLLHIGNAMMVYLLFTRIQTTPTMASEPEHSTRHQWFLPLFAALLFVCHPLQTQSIVYIVQRFVPLATFFYLGALLLYDTSRSAPSQIIKNSSYIAALAATVLAMGSKEIAFTLPAVIMLYELMFFSGKLSTRLLKIVPFLLTMAIIPMKLGKLAELGKAHNIETMQSAMSLRNIGGATPLEYLFTQFGVITTYLRLLVVPVNQNVDYDYPLQTSFFSLQVILPLFLLLAIAGFGVFCLLRSKENKNYNMVAFGIFWFFITISVESSVVPIKDLIFEHRAYLPSVGFFIALLAGGALLFQHYAHREPAESNKLTLALSCIVVIFSIIAINRINVWDSEITLWRDVVKKSPGKARVHNNLGAAYFMSENMSSLSVPGTTPTAEQQKLMDAALQEYRTAIKLDPKLTPANINMAKALMLRKEYAEALKYTAIAQQSSPFDPDVLSVKGAVYEAMGNYGAAEQAFREALHLDPTFARAQLGMVNALIAKGNIPQAIQELERLIRDYPEEALIKKLDELKQLHQLSKP